MTIVAVNPIGRSGRKKERKKDNISKPKWMRRTGTRTRTGI